MLTRAERLKKLAKLEALLLPGRGAPRAYVRFADTGEWLGKAPPRAEAGAEPGIQDAIGLNAGDVIVTVAFVEPYPQGENRPCPPLSPPAAAPAPARAPSDRSA